MSIQRALLSVSDKTNIIELATFLIEKGITILSTGGTAALLKENNIAVTDVSDVTKFPEIMDGRVKTLHPNVHGGILAVRGNDEHVKAMDEHGIEGIDLVVINLYPFEETIEKSDDYQTCIENIDIGGPAMVRASAKNHQDVTIVVDPTDYESLKEEINSNDGATSLDYRKKMAAKAFARTAEYDGMISRWFSKQLGDAFPEKIMIPASRKQVLRYGENPHQEAALYLDPTAKTGVANAEQLQGKELSYNNLADTDAALRCVLDFEEPAVVIVKHANPCGVAVDENVIGAFDKALSSDPISAYGSIVALNRAIDEEFLDAMGSLFVEVIIAPEVTDGAKKRLAKKKNLRLLIPKSWPTQEDISKHRITSISGGYLFQSPDNAFSDVDSWNVVSKRKPTDDEIKDMVFAEKVCKHVKSNAIVLAKNEATVGVGAGQTNRLDSVRIAAWRAKETAISFEDASGSVLASDAFFPFADGLEAAVEHGITAIVQPGGSIRDDEVIEAADKHGIAMVFTGVRHFNH